MINKQAGETVLVTGANGFVGSHVIVQLLEKNYNVIGTVRTEEKRVETMKNYEEKYGKEKMKKLQIHVADLETQDNWENLIKQCSTVIHVATPTYFRVPKDKTKQYVLDLAVNGLTNIIELSAKHNIKKVIITSTVSAVCHTQNEKQTYFTSDDWTEESCEQLYPLQKTLSEKKAWQLAKKLDVNLTTICPGLIFGRELFKGRSSTTNFLKMFFKSPIYLDSNLFLVSVEDVAKAHVLCVEKKDISKNKRYLAVDNTYRTTDILNVLKEEFSQYGYQFAKIRFPNIILSFFALFMKSVRSHTKNSYERIIFDTEQLKEDLGMQFQGLKKMLVDTTYGLIENEKLENRIKQF